jgi:hypothetical protein
MCSELRLLLLLTLRRSSIRFRVSGVLALAALYFPTIVGTPLSLIPLSWGHQLMTVYAGRVGGEWGCGGGHPTVNLQPHTSDRHHGD